MNIFRRLTRWVAPLLALLSLPTLMLTPPHPGRASAREEPPHGGCTSARGT